MKNNFGKECKEIIIRDAITAGVAKAFELEVIPQHEKNEVTFILRGDVDAVIQKIANNSPIGSRDVLEAIKSCRSAIFLFRQGDSR